MQESGNCLVDLWSRSKGILFDFDGVLADSEPYFRMSWNRALSRWGHVVTEADYWKYWTSLGEGLAGEIRRKNLSEIDEQQAREVQSSSYTEFVLNGSIPLFPEAAEVLSILESLPSEIGKPFCIASNTPRETVERIISCHADVTPRIVGGDGLMKKPSPEIFLSASSKLNIPPQEALVFEDSWKGIEAARSGGIPCVLVLNDQNRNLDLSANCVIDGLEPLLELLRAAAQA